MQTGPNTRVKTLARGITLVGSGYLLIQIYFSVIVANTYFSPLVGAIMIVLGASISTLGVLETILRLKTNRNADEIHHEIFRRFKKYLERVEHQFPRIFAFTLILIGIDIATTLYGISVFGIGLERNRAVAELLRSGRTELWIVIQILPLISAWLVRMLLKRPTIQTIVAFYVMGTTFYALGVAINNIRVLAAFLLT